MKDAKQLVEEMLQKHKELSSNPVQEVQQVEIPVHKPKPIQELIPSITIEEKQELNLPALPSGGLFLDKSEVMTKDAILKRFAPDKEKYEALNISQEDKAIISRSLGRMTTGASAAVPMICRGEGCSYHVKCVSSRTEVLTTKGNKQIVYLVEGETIYSANDESKLEKDTVLKIIPNGIKICVEIRLSDDSTLISTLDHRYRVYTLETEKVSWMKLEDILKSKEKYNLLSTEPSSDDSSISFGDFYLVDIIEVSEPFEDEVYDLTIALNSNFIANNILVHNCDFYKLGKIVIGEDCLLEENLIEYWTTKYIDEFDIDLNSITELHTISRLVEITVKEMRMNLYSSIHEPDLMQDFITSVDEQGNEIVNKGVSTAHTIREQLDVRKLKILESLNATRERKAKLQLGAASIVSEQTSYTNLRNTIETLAAKIAESSGGKIVNE